MSLFFPFSRCKVVYKILDVELVFSLQLKFL
jgi:hypothetical protein